MGKLVHFHSLLGTGSGCCTTTRHHQDCSKWGLSPQNESACTFRRDDPHPEGRECRCVHKEPDILAKALETLKVPKSYNVLVVPQDGLRCSKPKRDRKKSPRERK